MFVKSLVLVLTGFSALPAALAAQSPPSIAHKAILTFAIAQQVAANARQIATDKGWPCALAIVDDGGWPILTTRMDGAPVVAGIELAQGKARTSALFKRPSADLENAINGGRQAALSAGLLMMKGAQPIILEGQVVGAIGISADTPAHDDEIALAPAGSVQP
ncbi:MULTISPECIES: heme-binding protein [unclassified Pseudomonas]|uniref:GlcG/HbpS family heme-binding protein n=1 Tax=unclassified Pseudomonas TaxID=196821 RepID=UPI0015A41BD3|nr:MULTISPECIES: heme-binding protein [unclassified Pseudomonas]NWC95969.1 heme-binding protein [Pseudomonas sp. IPO3779]NWD20347.1 heme-binding protein [Pseudomonas sp. IPO3778]